MQISGMLFGLGQIVLTPGARDLLIENSKDPLVYIARHITGDWGDLDNFDKEQNNLAVKNGDRILSSYKITDIEKIWIITEWDRSATTILLPEEY